MLRVPQRQILAKSENRNHAPSLLLTQRDTARGTQPEGHSQRDLIFLTAIVRLRCQDKSCLDGPLDCGYGARELFVLVN